MAKQEKPKGGVLERRREKKREKGHKKARRAADQHREGQRGEGSTRGWLPEGGGS